MIPYLMYDRVRFKPQLEMSKNYSDFSIMEGFLKESIYVSLWKSDTNLTDKVEVASQWKKYCELKEEKQKV